MRATNNIAWRDVMFESVAVVFILVTASICGCLVARTVISHLDAQCFCPKPTAGSLQ